MFYASEASCRSCSADLEALARQVPKDVRVIAVPPGRRPGRRRCARCSACTGGPGRCCSGRDLAARLELKPRSLLLVARGGWTLGGAQARRSGPRSARRSPRCSAWTCRRPCRAPSWNRRPVDRSPLPPPPALLPEGLAPGEDEPFPPEFTAAVEAYRAGRAAEARKAVRRARGEGRRLAAAAGGAARPRAVPGARRRSATPRGGSCCARATAGSRTRSTAARGGGGRGALGRSPQAASALAFGPSLG